MNNPIKFALSSLIIFLFYACQPKTTPTENDAPKKPAYVNFSLGTSTLQTTQGHTIALYGCNTSVAANTKHWKGPESFTWNTPNQVVSDIPFGHQVDQKRKESYHISKYYIASPPIIQLANPNDKIDNPNTLYDIGLVTPDEFSYDGRKPVQMVYLDYSILQPMHIEYIPVEFDASFDDIKKQHNINTDLIPFRVECYNFPWIDTPKIKDAEGASGIGAIKKGSKENRFFLPYYYPENSAGTIASKKEKKYIDAQVTILNDILFHYEVFFDVDGYKTKSINMKEFRKKHAGSNIKLHAEYREDLPCGCKTPNKE